ncbi:serine-threonine protein kinase [Streptomyces sp. URMC 123]|uniref:serine-threonine protein kinase n=1 Tax=Streptomyces sp. URMC 123 TaxID=3423403 RepID=UPI003F1D0AE6
MAGISGTGTGITVAPYWEVMFDADGDVSPGQRDRLCREAARGDLTDLLVFAHGWNNDRSMATRLYGRFFRFFPEHLGEGVRLGYAGAVWPSMRFGDESIPDFDPTAVSREAAAAIMRPSLDLRVRRALADAFPGQAETVDRLAALLDERPGSEAALEEFAGLVRRLVTVAPDSPGAGFAADTTAEADPTAETETGPTGGADASTDTAGEAGTGTDTAETRAAGGDDRPPAMLVDDPVAVCDVFAAALEETGAGTADPGAEGLVPSLGASLLDRLWHGAREMLRQATYYAMKRRAGTVGERGLGPALGELAEAAPDLRVHLAGHSFGGRLVSFALRGLPEGVRCVKSVTLLQGAFSHYAFAPRLPHEPGRSGALRGAPDRVDGPVVACHSRHDTSLRVLYPLASRLSGDAHGVLGLEERWGAMGGNGIQAVAGTRRLSLEEALGGPFPGSGCVSVDAAAVVRRGSPPTGAHSDICHEELARIVLAAGRIGRPPRP